MDAAASSALTPASLVNLAGRSSVAYRVGTHGSFKATMRAALARQAALSGLTTRADDDPSIALLDAWATVLDVLTFYQERIANEGFIRTAIEQRSILELARAIGYELNPGVAAGAFLAFNVDETVGSPGSVTLEVGTKVQSVPGQDELPQIFETTEAIDARVEWNAFAPQAAERIYPAIGTSTVYLQGISANLKPGDGLLIVGDERTDDPASDRWDFRKVQTVTVVPPSTPTADANAGLTIVGLDRMVGARSPTRLPAKKNRKSMRFASAPPCLDTTHRIGGSCRGRSSGSTVTPRRRSGPGSTSPTRSLCRRSWTACTWTPSTRVLRPEAG